MVAYRVV